MGSRDLRRTAAHYKGLAAGAQRMKAMGHKTASGGTPKKPGGCSKKTAQAVVLVDVGRLERAGRARR